MTGYDFNGYPEYRDTGLTWLGEIPAHWDLRPLKHMCSFSGGSTPAKDTRRNWDGGTVPWVSPKDMKVFRLSKTQDHITKSAVEESSVSFVEPGSILMVVRSGILQRTIPVAINSVAVTLNQDMKALTFPAPSGAEYFAYLVQGHVSALLQRWTKEGATVESVEHALLANDSVPDVPTEERARIVTFLDYETAKIDALIEKQQQLISLLKEKRQAVISHAVTKGLNPDAHMRDSGVEWLGEVPAHWEVRALGYLGQLQNGLNIGAEAFGRGAPFLSYGDVYNNAIVPSRPSGLVNSTTEDQRKYSLRPGDVLFTRTSEAVDDIGVASTCLEEVPNGTFAGFLIRFRPSVAKLNPQFSSYYFRRESVKDFFAGRMNLVTRASLGQSVLKTLPVAVPPLDEQVTIAGHLHRATSVLDELGVRLGEQADLLRERRTALISAAVTGKIDVRDWSPPDSAPDQDAA